MEARLDDILYQVTQQAGQGVHGLLDEVFGFLHRRTDFFYEMEPGDKMGFPPGVAESMVYQFFKKYQDQHYRKFPHKPELVERWKQYKEKQEKEEKEKLEQKQQNQVEQEIKKDKKEDEEELKESEIKLQQQEQQKQQVKEVKKEAPKQEQPKKEPIVDKISTYNGDATEKYNWSQGLTNVDVQIEVPKGTTSKQLQIVIKQKYLSCAFKGQKPFLEGELCEKVKVDDSFWSVEEGKYLNINFEKAYEAIWKCVLLGDKEIDTKTVDNSKRIEEFDLETQGHLQKVLYEQERKKRGLLTTEEEEQRKLMEKVMQAENSPFKGIPYDPKKYGKNEGNNGPSPPFAM